MQTWGWGLGLPCIFFVAGCVTLTPFSFFSLFFFSFFLHLLSLLLPLLHLPFSLQTVQSTVPRCGAVLGSQETPSPT